MASFITYATNAVNIPVSGRPNWVNPLDATGTNLLTKATIEPGILDDQPFYSAYLKCTFNVHPALQAELLGMRLLVAGSMSGGGGSGSEMQARFFLHHSTMPNFIAGTNPAANNGSHPYYIQHAPLAH